MAEEDPSKMGSYEKHFTARDCFPSNLELQSLAVAERFSYGLVFKGSSSARVVGSILDDLARSMHQAHSLLC